jgi:large subunit ribosomal protein L9
LDAATARADALSGKSVVVTAKAGDEGKLFGSIGTRDIAEAASAQGITLDKSEVRLPEGPLRMVGNHDVTVQLHADVMTTIVVTVTGE